METVYRKNVCLARIYKPNLGSRIGTANISVMDFRSKFGEPHLMDESEEGIDGAGKVHYIWCVETPRGIVEIRDYWWNRKDEMSITGNSKKQVLWVIGWLKAYGVKATSKIRGYHG